MIGIFNYIYDIIKKIYGFYLKHKSKLKINQITYKFTIYNIYIYKQKTSCVSREDIIDSSHKPISKNSS